jgi:hypothetical protein
MDEQVPEMLWTIEDFAAWLRITPTAARAMLRRRELPPKAIVKIGRRVRLRAEMIKAWVLKREPA